jgi:dephospho-CoA kinase
MILLGLTGSIGMGKSTTAKLFAEAGAPVYDADAAVHRLYEGEAVPAIEAAFPGTTADGKVDRALLSARVLHDPAAMKQLEQIVHPMLGASRQKFLHDAEQSGAPVAVVDVPLLFETGGDGRCDYVLVVSAPALVQRQRVLRRPDMTLIRLAAILQTQMPDHQKRRRADFVVLTGLGKGHTLRRLQRILTLLRDNKSCCAGCRRRRSRHNPVTW